MKTSKEMTTKQAYTLLLASTIVGFGIIYFTLKKAMREEKLKN